MTDEVTGRARGGAAAAAKMTPEERKERASKGALARWNPQSLQPLAATHKGSFKEKLGLDVECYVLNDQNKTAVITQLGMGEILGLGSGGSRLPRFIFNKTMTDFVGPELREKLENPLIFQRVSDGQILSGGKDAKGYDASILIDVCTSILGANASGAKINPAVVAQAGVILGASAKAGIRGLVYALAGYDQTKEEVIQAFKAFVQEEARKYEKEFPPELYAEWYRLYKIPKPVRGRPWDFKYLTLDHVYHPLAKSNGKLLELLKSARSNNGEGGKKLFSFLNEVGTRALRIHLGRILEMAESSENKEDYLKKIVDRFGGQQALDLA